MSYAIRMNAENVECRIPLNDMVSLTKHFEKINKYQNHIEMVWGWEEDPSPITGEIVGDEIILGSNQSGTYRNSEDGGLSYLLVTYKGSGTIEEVGEDGSDHTITKYENGIEKKGRIVFDDEDDEGVGEDEDGDEDDDMHTLLVGKTIKRVDDRINPGQVIKIYFTDGTYAHFTVNEDSDISVTEERYEP